MLLKKIFFALFGFSTLFWCANLQASHFAGGYINYRFIGDSTNVPGQYLVELNLFINTTGATQGAQSLSLMYRTDLSNAVLNATLNYISPPPGKKHPLRPNGFLSSRGTLCSNSSNTISINRYAAVVNVPLAATQVDFFFSQCCISQYANVSFNGSGSVLISAHLDRFLGENDLPRIDEAAFMAELCVGSSAIIGHINPDRDSNDIFLLRKTSGQTGSDPINAQNLVFSAGLSEDTPLPVDTNLFGYQVLPRQGRVAISPTAAGNYLLAFEIEDVRFDTASGLSRLVGTSQFELRQFIAPSCDSTILSGPRLNLDSGNVRVDSCATDFIVLEYNQALMANSIDTNGLGYRVYSKKYNRVDTNLHATVIDSNKVKITYTMRLAENDTLAITTMARGLGNYNAVNACGFETTRPDRILHVIEGCSNVALAEVESFDFSIYPNPAKETLELNYSQGVNIKAVAIMNLSGQVLRQYSGNPTSISLSGLAAGTYLLKVKTQYGASVIKKLIKN